MSRVRVAVIGAGIVGLSSAVRAIETFPGLDITVIAENFTPDTTGDGSAGYFCPYILGSGLPPETLKRWCQDSWDFFLKLCLSAEGSTYGLGLIPAYYFYNSPQEMQEGAKLMPGFRELTKQELEICAVKHSYGACLTSMVVECRKLLPYLMSRFQKKGGQILKRRVNSLSELTEYTVIMNCAGLGAAHLVPDPSVIPVRGQVYRVKAPWIKMIIAAGEYHIIPNSENVLLGGTHQEGDWNTSIYSEDSRKIWDGCCKLVPSLEKAEILGEWVGLRPYRECPRIERETLINDQGRNVQVIHNYGHGGSGVTIGWGCAADAVHLLKEAIGRDWSEL